mmetsp:Transcript_10785/g.45924  ORF Transcript_10785/g.45924 Transcript_10785/m.45924 type:complete len:252 (-) Transcript_10785:2220-2975(-)
MRVEARLQRPARLHERVRGATGRTTRLSFSRLMGPSRRWIHLARPLGRRRERRVRHFALYDPRPTRGRRSLMRRQGRRVSVSRRRGKHARAPGRRDELRRRVVAPDLRRERKHVQSRLDVRVRGAVARRVIGRRVAHDASQVPDAGAADGGHGVRGGEKHLRRAPLRLAEEGIGNLVVVLGGDARQRATRRALQSLLRRLLALEPRGEPRRRLERDGALARRVLAGGVVERCAQAERQQVQRRPRFEARVL